MNVAQTLQLADSWGMHDGSGWWVVGAAVMMLFMGAMMWMMMRGMGGGARPDSSPPESVTRETPMETLERRFAEGELTIEDYRARREALVDGTAESSGDPEGEQLTGTLGGEGRPS